MVKRTLSLSSLTHAIFPIDANDAVNSVQKLSKASQLEMRHAANL
jgi:hypothetical protein